MSNLNQLSDAQFNIIINQINQTEKNMNTLVDGIAALNRKYSRSREKVDELSKIVKILAENEINNESMSHAMEDFSKTIVNLADVDDLRIIRIEDKIINELVQYDSLCRNSREETKKLIELRDREIAKRKNIESNKKMRLHHSTSENEVMLSNIQLSKVSKELYSVGEAFEKQKLSDMKEILTNFILIQLKYFASGLEIFSAAYDAVTTRFDEKSDLEQFTSEIKKINREFLKHLEGENKANNKFKFLKAFNMFSHSTTQLDRIGKSHSNVERRKNLTKSQSAMSLQSLNSNESDNESQMKKDSQLREIDMKTSDTDSDINESTFVDQSDTITEEISIANQQQK